jgi:hypothetical protein
VREPSPPVSENVAAAIADDGAEGVHVVRIRLRFDIASGKGAETYNDAEEESGRERTREGPCKGEGSGRRQQGSGRNRHDIGRPSCEEGKP